MMFYIIDVFLTKVDFTLLRENVLKCNHMKINSNFDLKSRYNRKTTILEVVLSTKTSGLEEDFNILNIDVDITGIFKLDEKFSINQGDVNIDDNNLDFFTKVNAPSMLFPFLLENIHSLTQKAKIKPLIIPFIDFNKIYYEQKSFNTFH